MKIVSYIRVSTKSQGNSGLGLEAQRSTVEAFAKARGGKILAEHLEIESGKRKDRPELAKALAHCRRSKATLVVAKLDRLARNVAFTSALMDSSVDFVCCDNPHANRLTIHILAAVAEAEAVAISERTKAALAAAKARGVKLGSARPGHWNGREDRRLAGTKLAAKAAAEANKRAAVEAYADLLPIVGAMRAKGRSLQQIANWLNTMGHSTRRDKQWSPTQVARVLSKAESVLT
jgi:DNA invertase Pin-like site-specific DNA recombinase